MSAQTTFRADRASLMELFRRLERQHGPSGWWPSQYGGDFEIVCGAILAQRTAWTNVELALQMMRKAGIWDWQTVSAIPVNKLELAIRPSGFYRSKARKLKAFAEMVVTRYGGDLKRLLAQDMSTLRKNLLGVWGVGYETADDIILYSAQLPRFVIDAYTVRIMQRLGWDTDTGGSSVTEARYAKYQSFFEAELAPDVGLYQEYHGLIDLHASRVCRAKPLCEKCCLKDLCLTYAQKQKKIPQPKRGVL